jgi:hypothetical protein
MDTRGHFGELSIIHLQHKKLEISRPYPEDGSSMFRRDTSKRMQDYTVSHHKIQQCS